MGLGLGLGLGLRHALCHDALRTSVSNNFVHIRRNGIRRNGAEPLLVTQQECMYDCCRRMECC